MASVFDKKAKSWDDDPAKRHRATVVADAVRASVRPTESTRLLEYGAGTGLVSQCLADHVGPVTLADPSAGMREVIGDKIAAGTLPAGTRVWELDLTDDDVPAEQFDLIVTVMTLHHIHDLAPVLSGFASLLAQGGDLCVVDLEAEDGSFHDSDDDFDGHHGFDRADLADQLASAGFSEVRFEDCHEVEKNGRRFPLFLASCRVADASRS